MRFMDPPPKKNNSSKSKSISRYFTLRNKFIIIAFALYITFILLSRVPYIAESETRRAMQDKYDYNLVFPTDGNLSHYYVERIETLQPGKIDLTYWTKLHTLNVKTTNIKKLTIDCKSIYYDESMKVFEIDPSTDPDYYKDYFIDKNQVFLVNVLADNDISELRFKYAPEPSQVYVNDIEWWETNINYRFENPEIVLTNVSIGSTNVKIYFETKLRPEADFLITGPNYYVEGTTYYGYQNKDITFDASVSNDNADSGSIVKYEWDFGDSSSTVSGKIVTHQFTQTGTFDVTLTVTDNDDLTDDFSLPITIIQVSNDQDDDGMDDTWETTHGLDTTSNDAQNDPDSDRLTNFQEYQAGTDPRDFDTDDDKLPDGWEDEWGLDPNDPTGVNGADGDPDGDLHSNMNEYEHGTLPFDNTSYYEEPVKPEKKDEGEDSSLMYGIIVAVVIIIIILLLSYIMIFGRRRRRDEPPEGGMPPGKPPGKRGRPPAIDAEGDLEVGKPTAGGDEYEEEFVEELEFEGEEFEPDEGFEDWEAEADIGAVEELEPVTEVEPLEAIKPEVRTIEVEDRMEVIELGMVHPCTICQAVMPAGEKAFQCTCGLISHGNCVAELKTCPQCGKEIDLEGLGIFLKPPKLEKKVKKPLIRKEITRKVVEREPPFEAYFVYIPKLSSDRDLIKYLRGYLENQQIGKSAPNNNLKDVRLLISLESAQKMLDHCYEKGRQKEVMGLMIGQTFIYHNETYSYVKDIVSSELDATEVAVRFDSFDELFNQLDQLDYDYQIIGWYHSHPEYTSFMSPTDIETQQRMFKLPHQYAVVIDPIKFDMNAFVLDTMQKKKVKERGFAIVDLD